MKKYIKILSLLLALLMLLGVTGCSKMTGEWISEREYYYYDEDGNWTKLTDEDKIAELGGNAANKSDKDKEDKNDKIDTSNLQVLTDYMGNDGWEKTFDHKNMSIESLHADVLLDDYRVRRTDMADGYVTYKVDGVGEILLQYSFGVGDRFASEPVVTVSKDGEKWDVVKPQSTTYEQFNGDSWVKYVSYYGGIDTANQYVKVTLLNTAKHVYDPNLNFIQINGITEKLLGELGGYAEGISQAKTIYVDSKAGKDTNDGTSEDKPLKTLSALQLPGLLYRGHSASLAPPHREPALRIPSLPPRPHRLRAGVGPLRILVLRAALSAVHQARYRGAAGGLNAKCKVQNAKSRTGGEPT